MWVDEQTQPNPDNYSDTTEMEPDNVSKILSVGVKPIVNPYTVELELDGKALDMDIDTGATVSLILREHTIPCSATFCSVLTLRPLFRWQDSCVSMLSYRHT